MELNAAQAQAVTSQSHRLLILAGPGTGKTETLTERIAYFIEDLVLSAAGVLMFTYTNKAASNMTIRIQNKLSIRHEIQSGTFHGLCHRFTQREICTRGILPSHRVLPEHHAERLRKQASDQFAQSQPDLATLLRMHCVQGADLLELYERKTKLNLSPDFLSTTTDELREAAADLTLAAQALAELYRALKEQYHVVDFNDLLFNFLQVLRDYDDVRQNIQFQFPHVYVDEYQDTNRVQVAILQQLLRPDSHLTVVGDDTQSIYSFQGAQVENIRNFARDFPGADAVVLNENYRSSPPIVSYANAVNATCVGALTKTLISRGPECQVKPKRAIFMKGRDEAEWVLREIKELMKNERVAMAEIAVLTRIGHIAADLEKSLQRNGIPYTREGGIKFAELKHIQFFLSFLELLDNPRDWLAWEVLLPAIPNIGEQLTQVILGDLQADQGNWTWKEPPVFSLGQGKRFESLMNFWRDMVVAAGLAQGSVKEYLKSALPYFQNIYTRYFHVAPRMIKMSSVTQLPDRMEDHIGDIRNYIVELSTSHIGLVRDFIGELVAGRDRKATGGGLTVSTIHSAKGLEWDAVFVIGNAERVFPSAGFGLERNELEEERRLYYVACSRAKRHLYITCAHHYHGGDYRVRGAVSRFADDPRTLSLIARVKEPGHNPFYSVNPHRVRNYFLTVPPIAPPGAQAALAIP